VLAQTTNWLGFLLTAGGYLVLALALIVLGHRNRQSWLLAGAFLVHGSWALSVVMPAGGAVLERVLQTAHYVAWSAVFASIFVHARAGLPRFIILVGLGLIVARLALAFVLELPSLAQARLSLAIDLGAVLLALVAVVGLFQTAGESERWSLKFLCFPLGALFAYDLFLYTQAMAIALPDDAFLQVRGPLHALAMPLVGFAAWRQKAWRKQFTVSRQAALYSITLIGLGLYLLLVAAAALAIERLAPGETTSLQVVLLFAAGLLIAFLLSSGRARAKIKFFVGRHFYERKYDYAHEWRKFMQTLAVEEDATPLELRVIRACADLLEVPGGALWNLEQGSPQLSAIWNYRAPTPGFTDIDEAVFKDSEGEFQPLSGAALAASPLGRDPQAWVAVPLPHGTELAGFILLAHPRAKHELEREDTELVMLVARQCASFLAEKRAASELEENRQFVRFNRQYAFVAHDIKNIISQLSVMLRNFERHGDNPEFREDMLETIANAVDRLQKLVDRLKRLSAGESSGETRERLCAYELISAEIKRRKADSEQGNLTLSAGDRAKEAEIRTAGERLVGVFGHLLSNAQEASGDQGRVHVHLDVAGRNLVIDIADDGEGMSLDFIRDRLFTPFQSTKSGGFGVGAYQCREFAREHGGDLEVVSSPGSGTTMRLRLPLAVDDGETSEAVQP